MKKLFIAMLLTLFALALVVGCTKKESEDASKAPAGTSEAEMKDSTKMDSSMSNMTADSSAQNVDTMH